MPLAVGVGPRDGPQDGRCPSRWDKEANNHEWTCSNPQQLARQNPTSSPFPHATCPFKTPPRCSLSQVERNVRSPLSKVASLGLRETTVWQAVQKYGLEAPRQRSWNDGLPKSTLGSPLSFTRIKSSWKEWFASDHSSVKMKARGMILLLRSYVSPVRFLQTISFSISPQSAGCHSCNPQ